MKHPRNLFLALVLMFIVGTTVALSETEEGIPLSEVPKKVLAAAQKAVPGIKITGAEVEVYELEGTLDGKEYEIEVTADGKVLEVEQENDEADVEDTEDEDEEDEKDDD